MSLQGYLSSCPFAHAIWVTNRVLRILTMAVPIGISPNRPVIIRERLLILGHECPRTRQ